MALAIATRRRTDELRTQAIGLTAKTHRTISAYTALSAVFSDQLGWRRIRSHVPAEVGAAGGAHFVETADGGNARRLVQ